jgi:3'(2'), 5'-bisphosphate nucleotidase
MISNISNLNKLESLAIKAAVKAGFEILKIYQKDFTIEFKEDQSPLTTADKKANEIIMSFLSKTKIPIISEENKQIDYQTRKNWESCWIVDPLDGTKEFIKKNGEFTVNIALVNNQKTVLGIIYVPDTGELYVGNTYKNKTYKNIISEDVDFKNLELIEIPKQNTNNKVIRIVGSRSHINTKTEDFVKDIAKNNEVKIVSKGSSLKFCLIAEGKADIYPRFAPTMEWDTAAGQAICEASGIFVISNETKKALLYNKENLLNPWFIVQKTN